MFLKQMKEEVWHLASLCVTYNDPIFFLFFRVWQTDPIQHTFLSWDNKKEGSFCIEVQPNSRSLVYMVI